MFKRQSQETYLLPLDVMQKSLNLDSKDLDFNSNNRQWLWLPGWQKAFPEDLLGPGKKLVRQDSLVYTWSLELSGLALGAQLQLCCATVRGAGHLATQEIPWILRVQNSPPKLSGSWGSVLACVYATGLTCWAMLHR